MQATNKSYIANRSFALLGGSILISLALLWILFRDIDWTAFLLELSKTNIFYVVLMLVALFFSLYARVRRWAYILPQTKQLKFVPLFHATVIGFFASSVLPLRAGEVIRPMVASKLERISFGAAFASIVTERIFDVLSLLVMFAISFSALKNAPNWVTDGAWALGILALALSTVVFWAYLFPVQITKAFSFVIKAILGKRYPKIVTKLIVLFDDFVLGLKAIESFKELVQIFLWSSLLWCSLCLYYQLGLFAMGEFPSWMVSVVVSCLVAIAVAAPSAPGFIGVFQLGCVVALSYVYQYTSEFSLAYSLIVHLVQYVAIILLGFFCLSRAGLHLSKLKVPQENHPSA